MLVSLCIWWWISGGYRGNSRTSGHLRPKCSAACLSAPTPRIVHFVFGLDATDEFGFTEYLSVLAVRRRCAADTWVLLHLGRSPSTSNRWLTAALQWPRVLARPVRVPRRLGRWPVRHAAHAADWLRLEVLARFGGLYLDADVWVLRDPFDLVDRTGAACGIGVETVEDGGDRTVGLCNAVLWSVPGGCPLLHRWMLAYRSFQPWHWNRFSVVLPWQLAQRWPAEIQQVPAPAFFPFSWDARGLRGLYGNRSRAAWAQVEAAHAVHLWAHAAQRAGFPVRSLTAQECPRRNTTLHAVARSILREV